MERKGTLNINRSYSCTSITIVNCILFANLSQYNTTYNRLHLLHDFDGKLLAVMKLVAGHMCRHIIGKHFTANGDTLKSTRRNLSRISRHGVHKLFNSFSYVLQSQSAIRVEPEANGRHGFLRHPGRLRIVFEVRRTRYAQY